MSDLAAYDEGADFAPISAPLLPEMRCLVSAADGESPPLEMINVNFFR